MIKLKTAVLLGCSLKIGALLASADSKDVEMLYEFGINLGLAFQLQDDLLDTFGDSKVFGKQIGGDILNAKKTFLLVKALELANEDDGKEIIDIIGNDGMPDKDKIAAIQELYDRYQIKELTQSKIEMYLKDFKKSITIINSSRTTHLLDLVDSMANRLV